MKKLTRVYNEIVVLLQEKNYLVEASGKKNFVKVGGIERQLGWTVQAKKPIVIDPNDFYSKKLRREIEEHETIIVANEKDNKLILVINKEMKAFISAIVGNDGWIKAAEADW